MRLGFLTLPPADGKVGRSMYRVDVEGDVTFKVDDFECVTLTMRFGLTGPLAWDWAGCVPGRGYERIRVAHNLPFMLIFCFSVHLEDGASHGAACAMLAWIEGAARACVPCRPNWFILHYAPSRFARAFLLMRGGFYLFGL